MDFLEFGEKQEILESRDHSLPFKSFNLETYCSTCAVAKSPAYRVLGNIFDIPHEASLETIKTLSAMLETHPNIYFRIGILRDQYLEAIKNVRPLSKIEGIMVLQDRYLDRNTNAQAIPMIAQKLSELLFWKERGIEGIEDDPIADMLASLPVNAALPKDDLPCQLTNKL